jgi:RNA polymerase primary sigma factor
MPLLPRSAFDAYLAEARHVGLLSADEERAALRHLVELRKRRRLTVLYRPGSSLAVGTDAFAAYDAWKRREDAAYHEARNRFVCANLRLVVQIARRYARGWTSLADRVQEGNFGLLEAIERFDVDRGTRFSTYAVWWIRHCIQQALVQRGREIRIPPQMQRTFMNARRIEPGLRAALCRDVSLEELAAEIGVSAAKLADARSAIELRAVELPGPTGAPDPRIHDVLSDLTQPDLDAVMDEARQRMVLHRALVELDPRSRDILHHHFGLDGGDPWTLRTIGERHHVSRERIRQIEKEALGQLRWLIDPLRASGGKKGVASRGSQSRSVASRS